MIDRRSREPVVLVTGSSGLIGSRLIRELAGPHRVVGLDVIEPKRLPPQAEFVKCDLTDDGKVAEAFAEVRRRVGDRVASVVHLAAYVDFSGDPSPLYEDLTVEGTRRLLSALQDFEAVEQLVFSSTLLVMKPCETGEVLTEHSPVRGEWDYPQSKLKTEDLIRRGRGEIPAVILRLAGAYDDGGHSPPLTQQIRRIHEKQLESYFFPGDAEHGQSFIHLDDTVDCLETVVERRADLEGLEVFLVGEPDVMSYGELQDTIGELIHGKEWPTIRIPAPVAKAGAWVKEKVPAGEDPFIKPWMIDMADAHYPVSIERIQRRLGGTPRRRLRDTLPAMVEDLRRDPVGFYEENDLPLTGELAERAERR